MSGGRGRGMTLPAWMTNTSLAVPEQPEKLPATTAPVVAAAPGSNLTGSASRSRPSGFISAPLVPSAVKQISMAAPVLTMPAVLPSRKETSVVSDPNNDASLWMAHTSPDGRTYWYNSVSQVSTYDKPFCLKTPEERAIPPCNWKEYFADGKEYYSNGTESTWVMPEEFRVWKQKMDELENKKKGPTPTVPPLLPAAVPLGTIVKGAEGATGPVQTYATTEEAMEAFKEMLLVRNVSATAKLKDVQDLCIKDPRWDALKSQGEKRQALAEYQTKKLKAEKEVLKQKFRKQRDAFLLMLAENTIIDARTDWRSAIDVLKDDQRFRNIEDSREREELFKDFVMELKKKEREDSDRARSSALTSLDATLLKLKTEGVIDRNTVWADKKAELMPLLGQSEFKGLEEPDLRRSFQKVADALAEEHRNLERSRRDGFHDNTKRFLAELRSLFESLVKDGVITPNSHFRDDAIQENLQKSEAFHSLVSSFKEFYGEVGTTPEGDVRGVFDRVVAMEQESYRVDRRATKRLLLDHNMRIGVESRMDDFQAWLLKVSSSDRRRRFVKEDGEEEDEGALSKSSDPRKDDDKGSDEAVVRQMLQLRTHFIPVIFRELHERAVEEREEDLKQQRKNEERFVGLLQEYFYRSDHLGTTWEDAKPILQRRSAYDALPRADRKRVFQAYMDEMAEKMKSKERSLRALKEGASDEATGADRSRSRDDSPSRKRGRHD